MYTLYMTSLLLQAVLTCISPLCVCVCVCVCERARVCECVCEPRRKVGQRDSSDSHKNNCQGFQRSRMSHKPPHLRKDRKKGGKEERKEGREEIGRV